MKEKLKHILINLALAIPVWGLLQLISFFIISGCGVCAEPEMAGILSVAQVLSIYSYYDQPAASQIMNSLLSYIFAIFIISSYRKFTKEKVQA